MKTEKQIDDLQVLERILQERLQSEFPEIVPLLVRCVLKNETLQILAEHPADVVPDPQQTLSVLQQAVQAEQPELTLPVKLYLRVEGNHRPYTFHRFTVNSPIETEHESFLEATPALFEDAPDSEASLENPFNEDAPDSEAKKETPFNWAEITETDSIWAEALETSHARSRQNQSSSDWMSQEELDVPAATANPWDRVILESEKAADDLAGEKRYPVSFHGWRPSLPMMLAGTGMSLVVFLGSFYALTRPCVIGSCKQIATAQQLSNSNAQTLVQSQSAKELLLAQQQLAEAIRILETIPVWSSDRKEAQELIKAYQAQSQMISEAIKGFNKAATASEKSQNPPYAASEWVEVKQLWQEAIALMQQVPKESNVYQVAQQKLKTYKANLAMVNQRLTAEEQANQLLETAKEGANVAKARQGVAQSLENWQLVQSTWQTSINQLRQIPQDTTAYELALPLLASYQPQLGAVRDRTLLEQFSTNTYKTSLRMAVQAKNSQASNQWSQAISNWRNALTSLKQIPNGTFYYGKAQSLISSYTDVLKQAQGRLQIAMRVQEASKDLNQTCSGVPQVCNYTILSSVIKVRMTPAYANTVKQKALSAKMRGDYNAQIGVVNHVLTVGEALETISENANLRLEVYGPDGAAIGTRNP